MTENLTALQNQLHQAAAAFATEAHPLSELLTTMVNDVARALHEPLEIFPVCHHSPASALHLIARLHQPPPKVIFIELCEDMQEVIPALQDCKLPVALQAFASTSPTFPPDWTPLSVVSPLTESSAEYQTIAYVLQHPETQLVFVDRAVDFVFQWQKKETPSAETTPPPDEEEAKLHSGAIALEVGSLVPTFDQFLIFLLQNAKVRHFAEWWDQYVEQALIGADYSTYRQVMFLIGSLIRRLGRREEDKISDRLREQHMWTRIKQYLTTHQIAPTEAMFICGAAHTVNEVAEFGVDSPVLWDIPPRTATPWLYGLLPSSFLAIEYQFGHPPGTISMAEATWKKSLAINNLKPFTLSSSKTKKAKPKTATATPPVPASNDYDSLQNFLTRPPQLAQADVAQLLQWCADIVALARKNGYLASTADSIAIYQTAMLLANLRHRPHPSPYDFQDAAITCLEKDYTPKKRNIAQLCQILLGGDRRGSVGYNSLPTLVKDIYDRLAPLHINLEAQTNQRALMDFKSQPELLACSEVLWRLHYALAHVAQPIMGERSLSHTPPIQESWELRLGKYQGQVIQLGYDALTIEQWLEQHFKKQALDGQANAKTVLTLTIDSILYLQNPRLTQELGHLAIQKLQTETGGTHAPFIFKHARDLVGYYRAGPTGLPAWLEEFVSTGYAHYATLLPQAFLDQGTTPDQIAGMLGFIFTFESLALSLGCSRSQLLIALKQTSSTLHDPAKLGLLWTAEWLLKLRSLDEMRQFFAHVFSNSMLIATLPDYLNGFILALTFTPRITRFVVELLGKLFAEVPDEVLFPWLPSLIMRLRPHRDILHLLIKEASKVYPASLSGFVNWQPAWLNETPPPTATSTPAITLSEQEQLIRSLLLSHPAPSTHLAQALGLTDLTWQTELAAATPPPLDLSEAETQVQQLLQTYPSTLKILQSTTNR